jgi:hypothetical protein
VNLMSATPFATANNTEVTSGSRVLEYRLASARAHHRNRWADLGWLRCYSKTLPA